MTKKLKIESLGEFFNWLRSHSGEPSDTRPKVALNKAFLAAILRLVASNPCTAGEVADRLGVNFESAYLGLRKLREKGIVTDLRGEYVIVFQTGNPC